MGQLFVELQGRVAPPQNLDSCRVDSSYPLLLLVGFDLVEVNHHARIALSLRNRIEFASHAFAGDLVVDDRRQALAAIHNRIVERASLSCLQELVPYVRVVIETPTNVNGVPDRSAPHGLVLIQDAMQENKRQSPLWTVAGRGFPMRNLPIISRGSVVLPFTVFVPHDVAERCYLSEALSWVALNRFPLACSTGAGYDVREDDDFISDLVPQLAEDDPLSDEECARVGLRLDPRYKFFDSGDVPWEPSYFKARLRVTTDEIARNTYLKRLFEAESFIAQKVDWEAEFKEFLDVHKSRLFLALRDSRICAMGKKLPLSSFTQSLKKLEDSEWLGWHEVEWEQIPSEFWISTDIDWSENWAEGKKMAYCLIMVKFKDLFELFPPASEVVEGVTKVGNAIMQDSAIAKTPTQKTQRGRPSHNWDEFHLEVARRLLQGNVPSKKEAFIQEMQDWCRAKWLFPVGRSTISQKLKPYYDQLIRNSKSSNN